MLFKFSLDFTAFFEYSGIFFGAVWYSLRVIHLLFCKLVSL